MLISLIHPGTGSASQYRVYPFERVRLIQSLFGYHHLTLSLMERSEAILYMHADCFGPKNGPRNDSFIEKGFIHFGGGSAGCAFLSLAVHILYRPHDGF